jgi:5'-nucleotidase
MRILRGLILCFAVGVLGAAAPDSQITVKLIAINDVHGYLQPSEKYSLPDPVDAAKKVAVPVGGAAYFATAIAKLKAANPLNVVVGAGDMVGASPLYSALFHDEPTIEALNAAGLEYTSVGNHEFDEGRVELLRKQNGGCRPGGTIGVDTCMANGAFGGAKFEYLAANVIDESTGKTLFPPYAIKYFAAPGGKRVGIAFIGVVLHKTPTMVSAAGVRGVRFVDEASAVNALLPQISARGVHAVVVLIHQGVLTKVGYDDQSCGGVSGDLLPELNALDRSIKLVISGHTHWAYICPHGEGSRNAGVFYTSAGRYGQMLSDIDVTLDVATGTVAAITAHNDLVINDTAPNPMAATIPALPPAPAIAALVARYVTASAPLVNRVIGSITTDITRDGHEISRGEQGDAAMDDVVADARLAATKAPPLSAQLAFINAGGVRSSFAYASPLNDHKPGEVTYGEAYSVLPFRDVLYTETLTGAKIVTLLGQQFNADKDGLLGTAGGLTYTWDAKLPDGKSKVVPGTVKINGKPIDLKGLYRVTVDGFLLEGGDQYTVLRDGANKTAGGGDLDSLVQYISTHSPLAPPKRNRVTRLN